MTTKAKADKAAPPRSATRHPVGEVLEIGGIRVICVPDYLITRVGYDPGTVGLLLPHDAAEAFLRELRKAGIAPPEQPPARPSDSVSASPEEIT